MPNNTIVIACNSCWYAYNFRLSLIKELARRAWRVTILAPRDKYAERLIETGASHRNIDLEPKGTNPFREIAAIRRYRAAYRELAPAVALQHTIKPNIYGSLAARAVRVPVINTVTGLGTMFAGGFRETMVRGLYRYAFSRAELTFFQNADDRALFVSHRIVEPDRSSLLPGSGVDTERFSPQPRRSAAFTFLMVGRLLRAKGVEDFLDAARTLKAKHPQSRFVLVGSLDANDPEYVGAERISSAITDGIVERRDHVDDIRPILAEADCVVLPSYYREGVPRSLLEAASMGKPLIAADSVGTREPVRDGRNGFLCRPRDPADLAAKMEAIRIMPREMREAMGAASRSYMIERFDERFVVAAYIEAVERLAAFAGEVA